MSKKMENTLTETLVVNDLVVMKDKPLYIGKIESMVGSGAFVQWSYTNTWFERIDTLEKYDKITEFKVGHLVREKGDGLTKNGIIYGYLVFGKIEVQWHIGTFERVQPEEIMIYA